MIGTITECGEQGKRAFDLWYVLLATTSFVAYETTSA
jgi:hypothetical protein